ncbi:hypothetical protein IPL68_05680 [Candidatus Saccharibacteria bacterium]|nr:MAG: hypothetical protein IPL68_05680 [Candidatus Saccharibacteria bacterium]
MGASVASIILCLGHAIDQLKISVFIGLATLAFLVVLYAIVTYASSLPITAK